MLRLMFSHAYTAFSSDELGFVVTLRCLRRQLAAMPCDFYRVRLIHPHTRQALPGERVWSALQLTHGPTLRFLRAQNREGYDVFFQPCAFTHNAGFILVDLDAADPQVVSRMRVQGHQPCVVTETSPGHLQAWIQVSPSPLPPAVATEIGRQLAHQYQGDPASIDWRHLGRLAGFTNQKPQRRLPSGAPPWVRLRQARAGLATHGASLVAAAARRVVLTPKLSCPSPAAAPVDLTPQQATHAYQSGFERLRIGQRFPQPDWSIVDLWIAKELLLRGASAAEVKAILRWASPDFPRRHANPEDYLQRTLARAARDLAPRFPARGHNPSATGNPAPVPARTPSPV